MKRLISIVFLAVFVFQSASGLLVLASFYLNRTYISKNLCENRFDAVKICKGKCYLNKQLKEKEQQQQKFPDLKQKEINLFCQEVRFDSFSAQEELSLQKFGRGPGDYSSTYFASIFHPPA